MKRRTFLGFGSISAAGCDWQHGDYTAIDGSFTGIDHARGHALRDATSKSGAWPLPTLTRRTRVLIAGGGIAGLAAARGLRLRGIDDFALFELEATLGGNSRGGSLGGMACPLGAHYLPVPGDDASEVQDFLEELGLRQRVSGRWQYDERHLCHSPQERLFFHGHWQEGLLPLAGVEAGTLQQYQRFAALVDAAQQASRFAIPAFKVPFSPGHQALDAVTFEVWLEQNGLNDPHLRWYLNYCCRDDYGAGIATVSAWAGLHYFASRHGFNAPGTVATDDSGGVLTWPDGNATLVRALAKPSAERLHAGCSVLRITEVKHGVEVDLLRHATNAVERWQAERCIVALPVFIAARVVAQPPQFLLAAASHLRYAPWAVANLHLSAPLQDRPGAAPAWDNVLYDLQDRADPGSGEAAGVNLSGTGGGLGYVDARHQTLDPRPGPTVLTHYRALGDQPQGRQQLLQQPWRYWRDQTLAELSVAHPDLPSKVTRIDITRYGHAMSIPVPGTLQLLRKIPSSTSNFHGSLLLNSKRTQPYGVVAGRLSYVHGDWSGYSIFEEAFTRGHLAGGV